METGNGTDQVVVKDRAPETFPEQSEEMVPISKVDKLTSVLQSQTAAEAARARAAEERATSIEAEKNDLVARMKAMEEDLVLAHRAGEGEDGETEASQAIVKRLANLRRQAEETETRLRRATEAEQRAVTRELKAAAKQLAQDTGAKEEDLLKHKDIHDMTTAALEFQVEALKAQLHGNGGKEQKPGAKTPGEFDSGESRSSGGDNEFLKRYALGQERGPAADKRAAKLHKDLGWIS